MLSLSPAGCLFGLYKSRRVEVRVVGVCQRRQVKVAIVVLAVAESEASPEAYLVYVLEAGLAALRPHRPAGPLALCCCRAAGCEALLCLCGVPWARPGSGWTFCVNWGPETLLYPRTTSHMTW